MAFSVLVLHGPNLSLLAEEQIDPRLEARASELGVELVIAQANGEEGLLDLLHEHRDAVDAVLVNPGVLAPFAFALAEGLALVKLPSVEVLLEPPRAPSALVGAVKQQVHDQKHDGYLRGLEALVPAGHVADDEEEEEEDAGPLPRGKSIGRGKAPVTDEAARPGKSIGRRPAAATPPQGPAAASRGKTIGRGERGDAAPTPPERHGVLTRAQVQERISQRLKGATTAEGLAQWARDAWTGLQRGAPVESGAKDTIENVLLTLMAGAKATDAILVAQMAKLDS